MTSRPADGALRQLPLEPPVLYLVRHAKAGSRYRFEGPDAERPLTPKGLEQARRLAGLVGDAPRPVRRALSSPAARCTQTLEPLAESAGVGIEPADWLFEGGDPASAFEELCRLTRESDSPGGAGGPLAACTHGDVMWGVLERLARDGVDLGDRPDSPKGGLWVLRLDPDPAAETPVSAAWLVLPDTGS